MIERQSEKNYHMNWPRLQIVIKYFVRAWDSGTKMEPFASYIE